MVITRDESTRAAEAQKRDVVYPDAPRRRERAGVGGNTDGVHPAGGKIKADYRNGKRPQPASACVTLRSAIEQYIQVRENVKSPETIRGIM